MVKNKNRKSLMGFSVREILQATGGTLLQGNPQLRIKGISTDTRTIKPQQLFVAIKGNNFNGHNFIQTAIRKSATALVISRGKSFSYPKNLAVILVKDTTWALGDIARFYRQRFNIPIIAITGSNGKTTSKEILAAVLGSKYKVLKNEGTKNNHIGVPLTLLKLNPGHEVAVLELGTNHPGEIKYLTQIALPTLAIITNIGPSHLEFFNNQSAVFKEKKSLLEGLRSGGIAILNNDDFFLKRVKNKNYKIITFGIKNKSDFQTKSISREEDRLTFIVNRKHKIILKTPATHNIYNALSAIVCAKILRLSYHSIARALRGFKFPPGRLVIKKFRNIKIIDDTYNANPASFRCAVDVLASFNSKGKKIAVCADMKELGKQSRDLHSSLGKYIAKSHIDGLITVGELARYISLAAREAGMQVEEICHVDSPLEASNRLSKILRPRDIVLIKGSRIMGMEQVIERLYRKAF